MDKKEIKKRLTSKWVWIAVLSQVVLVVALSHPEVANELKIIATALIEIATLIGVLNNPADKEKF